MYLRRPAIRHRRGILGGPSVSRQMSFGVFRGFPGFWVLSLGFSPNFAMLDF